MVFAHWLPPVRSSLAEPCESFASHSASIEALYAETKLLFLIRHGEAWSNFLEKVLGPDLWNGVVSKCGFTTGNGTEYQIFDAGKLWVALQHGVQVCSRASDC